MPSLPFAKPHRALNDALVQGFSILEMTVAVAIAAVIVALSMPLYRGYLTDRGLQNGAYLIQADLRLAQQAATARAGSGPRVEMCFRNDGYDIYAVNYTGDPINRTGAAVGPTLKAANAGQEYPTGITIAVDPTASGQVNCAGQAVVFLGSGEPTNGATITLSLNGRTYRLTIAPTTGAVTVGR